jgi:thiol-disulfide isomerase/thioredoxin
MYLDTSFQKFPETRKVAVYLVIQEGPKAGDGASHQCKPLSNEEIRNAAYVPSVAYDPAIDPQIQVARAQLEAARTHKKLLLIVGGTWCGWCRILDQTFRQNPELSELRDKNFVVVHLDGSDSAKTDCALQAYPPPQGYPFVYAFDAAGKLIAADNTGAWQSADGYNPKQIELSLSKWSALP